jgi:hypothetical protein
MVIVETPIFTRQISELLSVESYRRLQNELVEDPTRGKTIPGSGGLRKLRWGLTGRGKRGGARIIYYWIRERHWLLMLLAYPKGIQDDLTAAQKRTLRRLVDEELK